MGKLPVSHRYNRLPLLPSDSGGFQQELVAQDLPGAKVEKFSLQANKKNIPCNFIFLQIQIVHTNKKKYLSIVKFSFTAAIVLTELKFRSQY